VCGGVGGNIVQPIYGMVPCLQHMLIYSCAHTWSAQPKLWLLLKPCETYEIKKRQQFFIIRLSMHHPKVRKTRCQDATFPNQSCTPVGEPKICLHFITCLGSLPTCAEDMKAASVLNASLAGCRQRCSPARFDSGSLHMYSPIL
jgi:hypothetical protein